METGVDDEGWIEVLGGEAAAVLVGVGACTTVAGVALPRSLRKLSKSH